MSNLELISSSAGEVLTDSIPMRCSKRGQVGYAMAEWATFVLNLQCNPSCITKLNSMQCTSV
jgi:hypothetical protein